MRKTILVLALATVGVFVSVPLTYPQWTITNISNNSHDDSKPQINNRGYVVWSGYHDAGNEIFLYDGTTLNQITGSSSDSNFPQINDSGHVVWRGSDGSDSEIFLATPRDAKAMPWIPLLLLND